MIRQVSFEDLALESTEIVKGLVLEGIGIEKIMVITSYNKYLSTYNTSIQAAIVRAGVPGQSDGNRVWYVGNRVMYLINNNSYGIFNGSIGTVVEISADEISVEFGAIDDPNVLPFKIKEAAKNFQVRRFLPTSCLTLAYALTIDKSQRSEWDFVVLVVPYVGHHGFMNSCRVYTAINRARRSLWILTPNLSSLEVASTREGRMRVDYLADRLRYYASQ